MTLTTPTEWELWRQRGDLRGQVARLEAELRTAHQRARELRTRLDLYEARPEPEISTLGT